MIVCATDTKHHRHRIKIIERVGESERELSEFGVVYLVCSMFAYSNQYYQVSVLLFRYFVCCGCKHLNKDHLSECHTRAVVKKSKKKHECKTNDANAEIDSCSRRERKKTSDLVR